MVDSYECQWGISNSGTRSLSKAESDRRSTSEAWIGEVASTRRHHGVEISRTESHHSIGFHKGKRGQTSTRTNHRTTLCNSERVGSYDPSRARGSSSAQCPIAAADYRVQGGTGKKGGTWAVYQSAGRDICRLLGEGRNSKGTSSKSSTKELEEKCEQKRHGLSTHSGRLWPNLSSTWGRPKAPGRN